jgi:hypothetical protein
MADLIQIANLSLSRIGTRSSIADLTEDSPEARAFSTVYDQARDETLEAVDWGFARARRALADLGSPPVDWLFRYAYPSDCLKIRSLMQPRTVNSGGAITSLPSGGGAASFADCRDSAHFPPVTYETAIDLNSQGNDIKAIYCDQPAARVIFTKRITNTALFPASFVAALSWACGAQMAIPLTGSTAMMQACLNQWKLMLTDASVSDANEGTQQQSVMPDWLLDR